MNLFSRNSIYVLQRNRHFANDNFDDRAGKQVTYRDCAVTSEHMQCHPWTRRRVNVETCCLCLFRQVTILALLSRKHPLDVPSCGSPCRTALWKTLRVLNDCASFRLAEDLFLSEFLAESTRHNNDSRNFASHTLACTEPKLSGAVVLKRRFVLLRHLKTQNWAPTTSSACVWTMAVGSLELHAYSVAHFNLARRGNWTRHHLAFFQNAEFVEAWW